MSKTRLLIVDGDPATRKGLETILQEWGYHVRSASGEAEARDLVESYDPGIVISSVVMPPLSGADLLRLLKAGNPHRPVVLVTAHTNVDLAVESMKQGAEDFITRPIDYPKLLAILKSAESDIAMRAASRKLTLQLENGSEFGEFAGNSKSMRKEDIPLLAQRFIGEFNRKHGTSVATLRDDAMEVLMTYSWPDNVREFRNVMERAVILARGE